MSDEATIAALREQAESVLNRAREDETYRSRLRDDPEGVLLEAGLPDDAARRLAHDELGDATADTVGLAQRQRYCSYTCDTITCIVTWCGAMPYSN